MVEAALVPRAPSTAGGAAVLVLCCSDTRGSHTACHWQERQQHAVLPQIFLTRKQQEAWKPFLIVTRRFLLDRVSARHGPLGEGKVTCDLSRAPCSPISDEGPGAGETLDTCSHALISSVTSKLSKNAGERLCWYLS